ncbi:MAG: ABC transporter substrate-binding protein [Peptococcaceae bacterium]|nr:ABC transporter substrate-binding protein [Peptococcaceae bacterium]
MKRFFHKGLALLLALTVLLALGACGSGENGGVSGNDAGSQTEAGSGAGDGSPAGGQESNKIVIQDQLGKTIELDGVPQRVATTIMPFPYIYYAVVGNSDNLIGCNPSSIVAYENSALKYMYPELAGANTSFVDTSFIVNVEELLKLKPDVVFQWNYMDEEIAKMEAAGIKVVALQYGTLDDLETWIRIIGKMFQKEDRAEELISLFHENVDEVKEKIDTLTPEDFRNILILSDNMEVTGTGFAKYWVENSGAINPAGELSGQELNVDMEQVLEWDPEIIYIGNFTELQPSDLLQNKLPGQDWSLVRAVKDGQVYKIPIGGYRWDPPGVETPLMIKWLAKIQHPQLFSDMDMRQEVKEFYQDVYRFTLTDAMLDEILNDIQN